MVSFVIFTVSAPSPLNFPGLLDVATTPSAREPLGTMVPRRVTSGFVTVAVNGDPAVAVLVLIVLSNRTTIGVPAGITIGGGGGGVFSTAASEFGIAFFAVSVGFGATLSAAPGGVVGDAVSGDGVVPGGGVVSGAGLGAGGGSGFVLATG